MASEMYSKMQIRQGATSPCVRCYVSDERGAIDLTGATATFTMWTQANATVIDGALATVDTDKHCVEYHWSPGETLATGVYRGLFTIVLASGEILIVPVSGPGIEIEITPVPPK